MGPLNVFSLPANMISSFVNRGYGGDIAGGSSLSASGTLLLADSYDMENFSSPHLLLHRCFLLLDAGSTQSHRLETWESSETFVSPDVPCTDHRLSQFCLLNISHPPFPLSFSLLPSPPPPFPLLMLQFKLCLKGLDSSYPAANACIFTSN